MTYVLGIDGGGTKTVGVITNEQGEVIAEATFGATNPNSVEEDQLTEEISKLFRTLQQQSDSVFYQLNHVFAGIAGCAHRSAKEKVKRICEAFLPQNTPITVDNDAIIALYSGTYGHPGIVQIAGTGSVTYGVNGEGKRDRVGGWGHLIGEKGSGFSLGRDALEASFRAYDQVDESSELLDCCLEYFQVEALPDVIPIVYHAKNVKEKLAALSPLVFEAADRGDRAASAIIEENGQYIGRSIGGLIQKLFVKKDKDFQIPVVLTGGLFRRLDLFQEAIETMIDKQALQAKLVVPDLPPVAGAIIAALREEEVQIPADFGRNFIRKKG